MAARAGAARASRGPPFLHFNAKQVIKKSKQALIAFRKLAKQSEQHHGHKENKEKNIQD
ncbi:MAG: hypothetical protein ACYC5F_08060 [Thermoleophilia bacterium]